MLVNTKQCFFKKGEDGLCMGIMNKIFQERVVEICDKMAKEDWYLELLDKLADIRNEASNSDQFDKYDDLHQEMHCKIMYAIYVQAFNDAKSLDSMYRS